MSVVGSVWRNMKQRCYNPNDPGYKNYGGRGIKVCDRWLNSFEAFKADMGPRPSKQHTIERIDNNGNYEPGNCKWATRQEQTLNRRHPNLRTNNTSGVTGIHYDSQKCKWRVTYILHGHRHHVGWYNTKQEAIKALL